MAKSESLKKSIITKSAELAHDVDEMELPLSDCVNEYTEQLEDGSYLTFLRMWIGYMIEQGSKKAADIMKDIIRYRLAAR
jgi:hypothetical protein